MKEEIETMKMGSNWTVGSAPLGWVSDLGRPIPGLQGGSNSEDELRIGISDDQVEIVLDDIDERMPAKVKQWIYWVHTSDN